MESVPAKRPLISVVCPCFNEAECIAAFADSVASVFDALPQYGLEMVLVNDGSTDDSLQAMLRCQAVDGRIVIIDLSRNFGKEAALTAGLEYARGDAVIPLDVDLQDPPELIPAMLDKWRAGHDVVLARRSSRRADSLAKRVSARWFYRLHNCFSGQHLPENVGDFRLMDRKVIDALKMLPESCRFMKGIFAWLGFRTVSLDYVRPQRLAGKSKFNPWRLWNFALDGITSFSTAPLRVWTYLGAICALGAFLYAAVIFWRTLIFGADVPGYASIVVAIAFFGGLQLTGIGIIGEYLGRTYLEAKRRPVYLVRRVYAPEK